MTTVILPSSLPPGHFHTEAPLVQIGWWGQSGRIYSSAPAAARSEPGGFSPIYAHWGEECGHQIRPAGTTLTVEDDPKMLRETFCVAQTHVGLSGLPRAAEHVARLERLINECDRHRPLGPDGKHGDRHTATCGCEDANS